ncbi:MAG: bile acid:sodium symporter family protein [Gemmataceae bacterium]
MHFLKKHWFLQVLLGGIALAWFRPDWLGWTEHVDPRMVVGLALFLSAFSLKSRSLYETMLKPWPALWALVISYGLIPGVACLIGPLLPLVDYRLGLLVAASVPCTLASAMLWTRLAHGNEATALLVTVISTGTSWLFTTAWLTWGTALEVKVDSLEMMAGLFFVLVIPFAGGQLLRAVGPLARFSDEYKGALGVVARLFILVVIFKAAVHVRTRLDEQGDAYAVGPLLWTGAVSVGLHLFGLYAGLWSSKPLGFARSDRVAVAFASSQKTLPVSLYLFDHHFAAYPLAVVPIVFYHVGQLVVDTFIAEMMVEGKEELPAAEEAIV